MRDEAGAVGGAASRRAKLSPISSAADGPHGDEARRERERETHRRRPVRGRGRGDLVQGVAREPAAERRIERARERQAARARAGAGGPAPRCRDGAAQKRNPFRPVARRHSLSRPIVRYLF